ncbi:flagellar basal-body MS-ring/collar protein FliF [Paenibacillus beijingensis]|uniref:Flagellar M-ring protein n=1 Tax=Paenibacillus beijingensis TaxID=1126833 RepID=A0A0D5NN17_9BACL|nr:flagellar basal-body MS-ring/collar protein FliF [Paenibacillus beijingensis]AJY76565.1 flagellar M-ring protein FliF [Paenibacillus beijingensis]
MNETISRYRERLTRYWTQMGKKQKVWLGATVGILLLTIILLTYVFSRTQYELAFQSLDTTDAAAIMSYLDENGIAYKLENSGTSISVPSAVADRVKVEAGSQGLVQNGSIGFEAFNQSSSQFGMTDNEFNVKYRNALDGEIQQLLNEMQGVQRSKVVVNLPKESVFASTEEQAGASASVMITFKPGYRPSQDEIDGYFNLVKTSIPNLSVEDITISTPQGELAPSPKAGGNAPNTQSVDNQFQIQRKYESDLRRNIEQFLGPMVGSDNLVISVSSSLNFDQKQTDEQLVKPLDNNNNNGIILSEQTQSSSSEGTSSTAGGVAGTGATDVPGYVANNSNGGATAESNSRTTNYDYNKIKNTIVSGPYVVKDLSVSIGVSNNVLTPETQLQISNYLNSLVRSQLIDSGQDVTNDSLIAKKVAVIGQTFVSDSGGPINSGLSTAWLAGIGAAALALVSGILIIVLRRRKKRQDQLAAEEEMPAKVEYPSIDLESINNESQVRKNLETLAKRKPEEFVNLLRTWLVDE